MRQILSERELSINREYQSELLFQRADKTMSHEIEDIKPLAARLEGENGKGELEARAPFRPCDSCQ